MRNARLGHDKNQMLFLFNESVSFLVDGNLDHEPKTRSGTYLTGNEPAKAFPASFLQLRPLLDVPIGQHTVGVDVTFHVFARPGLQRWLNAYTVTQPSDWQFTMTRRFESTIEVVGSDAENIRMVTDLGLEAPVRRALTPSLSLLSRSPQTQLLFADVHVGAVPVDVAFDVVVRDAMGREQALGATWYSRGGSGGSTDSSLVLNDVPGWMLNSDSLEIVLRPNPRVAEFTSDIVEIWGRELVYRIDRILGQPIQR